MIKPIPEKPIRLGGGVHRVLCSKCGGGWYWSDETHLHSLRDESTAEGREIWRKVDAAAARCPKWALPYVNDLF